MIARSVTIEAFRPFIQGGAPRGVKPRLKSGLCSLLTPSGRKQVPTCLVVPMSEKGSRNGRYDLSIVLESQGLCAHLIC